MSKSTDTASRAVRTTKTFKAPVKILWDIWSKPEHIAHWWGPRGFTSTVHTMDFREGGEWNLTLHGPGGINYPNKSIFKEITPLHKIVFEHFNPHFVTTVLFTAKGNETQLEWTLLFDSPEFREIIVKAHKAEEGQKENTQKLEEYISQIPGISNK